MDWRASSMAMSLSQYRSRSTAMSTKLIQKAGGRTKTKLRRNLGQNLITAMNNALFTKPMYENQLQALHHIQEKMIPTHALVSYNTFTIEKSIPNIYMHTLPIYDHPSELAQALETFYDQNYGDFVSDEVNTKLQKTFTWSTSFLKYLLCFIHEMQARYHRSQSQLPFSDFLLMLSPTSLLREVEHTVAMGVMCHLLADESQAFLRSAADRFYEFGDFFVDGVFWVETHRAIPIVYLALGTLFSMQDTFYAHDRGEKPKYAIRQYGADPWVVSTIDELRDWYDRNGKQFFGDLDQWQADKRISEIQLKFTKCVASDFAMITEKHADSEAEKPELN